jgi:hypothetical protein
MNTNCVPARKTKSKIHTYLLLYTLLGYVSLLVDLKPRVVDIESSNKTIIPGGTDAMRYSGVCVGPTWLV